jgi:hypothetical protein
VMRPSAGAEPTSDGGAEVLKVRSPEKMNAGWMRRAA